MILPFVSTQRAKLFPLRSAAGFQTSRSIVIPVVAVNRPPFIAAPGDMKPPAPRSIRRRLALS